MEARDPTSLGETAARESEPGGNIAASDAWTTIVLAGTRAYGVCLDQLHSDVTRIAFEGRYEPPPVPVGEEPTGPQITLPDSFSMLVV